MKDDILWNSAGTIYEPTRHNTTCPALMFAANRNDRVIGRTRILVVSISTRNGFNHVGAPSGSRWAINFFGLLKALEITRAAHSGRPNPRVITRWVVILNVYGIKPAIFIMIIIEKIDEIIKVNPFNNLEYVRVNCAKIVFFMLAVNKKNLFCFIHSVDLA